MGQLEKGIGAGDVHRAGTDEMRVSLVHMYIEKKVDMNCFRRIAGKDAKALTGRKSRGVHAAR